ncbi:protein translocase subunit SecD [Ruminococcus sp. YE282]|uniref:protein translocase subunit SecD n=1 Tax=Ruminococcus sp. YE282 TaxID=3158780 RepID=UPI0008914A15|nr:protein translocase subunit SecD [Ruminococcus bromii]MEE3498093.1 protein translocase subunit SecD [Ruminococcus bromii]SCY06321.1 preprotein translocase subunit SecD [Ruminococcus bromii]
MKRVPKPVFFIVALLILAFTFTSVFGISYYNGDNKNTVFKGIGDIRWGIDIRGGVEATFKPADGYDATDEQLESAKSIIELRMVSQGITDYELYADKGSDRIIVRFPWKSDDTEHNAVEAINEISSTAQLTFRPGKEYETTDVDSNGEYVYKTPKGDTEQILMDGSSVKSAEAQVYQDNNGEAQYVVSLELTDDGARTFEEITTTYLKQTVSIWMDDIMLSAPTVQATISNGKAQISGSFTADEATALANKINAGALPFQLETANYGQVSPTLGENSLTAMAVAGVIAMIIISIIMIVFYRLPGLIAVISLCGQMGLTIAAVSGFFTTIPSFTMTLPGIAGMILSIGMGVDCNVITAERIKEELRTGRTLDGALEKGTKNSLSAIIDGNMTVVIVSIILMLVFGPANVLSIIFGESTTGTIYAFGYTLLIGVISNFIMGIFLTRLMLRSVSGFKFVRHKWLFGGAKNDK